MLKVSGEQVGEFPSKWDLERGNAEIATVNGDKAEGFVIAGPDMQFHAAQATVQGNKVMVWSPEVTMPVAVRYAWANNPPNNVRSQDGTLPLAPFRTDK